MSDVGNEKRATQLHVAGDTNILLCAWEVCALLLSLIVYDELLGNQYLSSLGSAISSYTADAWLVLM